MMMASKWIQVSPKDVIWENIEVRVHHPFLSPTRLIKAIFKEGVLETRFRYVTSWMASFGIIVAWFFAVSFVGLLSNVSQLCIQIKCVIRIFFRVWE
jgi:hypothetical protein